MASQTTGTSGFVVRRAVPADLEALGRLGALLMRAHYGFDSRRFMRPGVHAEEGYASFLASQLEDRQSIVLVAVREDAVSGYLYASIEPRSWKELRDRAGFIHDILVDEGSRRLGIADALLNEAMARCREQRVPRVILWTAAQNDRAQRLFARKGFRTTMHEMTFELNDPAS